MVVGSTPAANVRSVLNGESNSLNFFLFQNKNKNEIGRAIVYSFESPHYTTLSWYDMEK